MGSDSAASRRLARSQWPVRSHALEDDPGDDLSDVTTPAERIAMMDELATTAWTLAGRPLPDYDRANIPGRLYRPAQHRPDE